MDYCGVEFTAVESAEAPHGSGSFSISDKDKMKAGGEKRQVRAAAITQAHEAIGEGLRANAEPEVEAELPQLASDILHVLHGARGLPSTEAVNRLRPFVNTMRNRISGKRPSCRRRGWCRRRAHAET